MATMMTIGMIVATIRSVEWSEPLFGIVNTGEFDAGADGEVVLLGNSDTVVAGGETDMASEAGS